MRTNVDFRLPASGNASAENGSVNIGDWHTYRRDMPRLSVPAPTVCLSVSWLSASPQQTSSASNVLKSATLTLPSFADLVAGPRSPTERIVLL